MTEKEEKAIKEVKKILENANPFTMPPHIYFSLETTLNLIEKQNKNLEIKDKEIKELKEKNADLESQVFEAEEYLQK